jgi:hypothetical protein
MVAVKTRQPKIIPMSWGVLIFKRSKEMGGGFINLADEIDSNDVKSRMAWRDTVEEIEGIENLE